MDHPPRQALEKLLRSLFSGPELRQFVRDLPGGVTMYDALPGDRVSPSDLAHEAANVLERHGRIDAHFFGSLLEKRPGRRDEIQRVAALMSGADWHESLGEPRIFRTLLPSPSHQLFLGRQDELAALDAAWNDRQTRVFTVVALGGAGKSRLVGRWLDSLEQDGWRGARAVYCWSFDDQGRGDAQTSADGFIADALSFFGEPEAVTAPLHERSRRLAALLQRQRTLLVLDGLEGLQESPRAMTRAGVLRDPTLHTLLPLLAAGMNGLCVITSRLPARDLASVPGARQLALGQLSEGDGVRLLAGLGVRGSNAELAAAVRENQGHALTLTLLGTYLVEVCGGDARRRHELDMFAVSDEVDGGRARRVMAAYDAWLGARERALLRLVGLFDRPAEMSAVNALRQPPALPGLTDAFTGVSDNEWNSALAVLRRAGLLGSATATGALDAHPLVRAHFGETLRREQPETWRAAHARLYEHYLDGAAGVPGNLIELGRLVDAMIHGCHAGQHSEVYREVYRGRLYAGDTRDSVTRLGAFSLELSALAAFMEQRWDRPVATLEPMAQADILEVAAYDLRALGRLDEALVPAQLALALDQAGKRWDPAAVDAALVAEIELLLGRVDAAQGHARTAVELAQRAVQHQTDVPFRRTVTTNTLLAEVLHYAGNLERSLALFEETEKLQRKRIPRLQQLYALPGARYCALLLDRAKPLDGSALGVHALAHQDLAEARQRCLDVRQRAETVLAVAQSSSFTQFTTGLNRLSLGQAHLGLWLAARTQDTPAEAPDVIAHRDLAVTMHDLAVDELRQSGRDDALPRALLARAALRRFLDDRAGAALDLTEVEELAGRSGMRLLTCDAHLERARLALASDATTAAREHTDAARTIIAETGYHRRDRELAALDAALSRTH